MDAVEQKQKVTQLWKIISAQGSRSPIKELKTIGIALENQM